MLCSSYDKKKKNYSWEAEMDRKSRHVVATEEVGGNLDIETSTPFWGVESRKVARIQNFPIACLAQRIKDMHLTV